MLRKVIGNLDDNLGPHWGYTPGHPNLFGYINPQPYLDYDLNILPPTVVTSSTNQIVRTGPDDTIFTTAVTNVTVGQSFVSFAGYNGWYQVYLANENGPATGWIRAAPSAGTIVSVADPARGLTGVNVRSNPDTNASHLSYAWDKQRFASPASSGSTAAPWRKIYLAADSTAPEGWIAGNFITVSGVDLTPPSITGFSVAPTARLSMKYASSSWVRPQRSTTARC